MKKNNKILILIVLTIFFIGGFITYNFVSFNNNQNANKEVSKEELKKYKFLRIKYLVMEKNNNNYSLKETFPDHFDDYLSFASEYMLLKKDGDYYVADLNSRVNKKILNSITSYAFAINNNSAEMLDDCIFDDKKTLIKIPAKYYEKEYERIERENSPVQIELLSRLSKNDIKNISIKVENKKIFRKTNNIKRNGTKYSFFISGLKHYSKDDLKIYLNGSELKLNKNYYDYNTKSGAIKLNFSPLLVESVEVKYSNKFSKMLSSIIVGNKVNAVTYREDSSFSTIPTYTLSTAPTCLETSTCSGTVNLPVYRDDSYPGPAVTAELQIDSYHFGNGPSEIVWEQLSKDDFTKVGTKIDDILVINPAIALGFDHNDTKYIGTTCIHISTPSGINAITNVVGTGLGAEFPFKWKVSDGPSEPDIEGYRTFTVVFMLDANQYYWSATGTSGVVQTLVSVMNFRYKDEDKAKLKVKKLSYDGVNTVAPEGINIGLYSDDTCSTMINSQTTNSSGEVLFENLKVNTNYYINELEVNDNKWVTSGCKNAYIEKDDANKVSDGNYYYKETTYNNRAKKYCLKVKKVDAEDSSKVISGIKFSLTNGTDTTEGTTGEDGIYTFNYLVKNTNDSSTGYRLHEVSSDGTNGYWNDGATASDYGDQWIGDNQLTEMIYMVNGAASIYSSEPGGSYVCPSDAFTYTKADHKQYYCIKMKKVDKNTKQLIKPATFKNITTNEEHDDGWDGSVDGYTTFFTGDRSGSFTVQETVAPAGYSVFNGTKTSTAFILPRELSRAQAEAECKNIKCTYNINNDTDTCRYTPANSKTDRTNGDVIDGITIGTIPTFPDSKYLLNWYKEYETNGSKANGATFKVKNSSGKYIIVSGTESVADSSNPAKTKTCYKYSGLANDMAGGSSLVSGANNENGGVCISGIDAGTYTVIETSPVPNHTFGSSLTKDITASTVYTDNQIFKNYGTYTEVEKKVTDSNRVSSILDSTVLFKIETNKLKKIPFEIYKTDNNGNATGEAISFVLRDGIYYDLSSPDISLASGETATTTIYLNDNRRFKLSHLAWGKYVAKEKGHKDSGTCVCENEADCIGYYYPRTDQEIKFEITKCSSSNSVSSGVANNTIGSNTCAITYSSVAGYQDNTPTELWFTKKDFYGYEDSSDVASEEVDFVDDKERSDFDRIVFRVKDANGNYLKFIDVGAHITDSNNVCLNDNDYREYRYITDEELSLLSAEERSQLTIVTDLHTCGGHIRITNLCRGKNYTVEEVSVPENSVFILPEKQEDRETVYKVPCCEDNTVTIKTTQTVIVDKGTRVIFEKRDSRYGYLIPDETTTFNVYQCKKGVECHPANGINSDMKLMKFSNRALITGDEEDYGKEVYNAMSDTDVKSGKQFVTDLHPYKGDLILRYLPSGYEYVLLETVAPKNYVLPSGTNAETRFTVVNNTVNVEEVDVPNKPTSLLIRKYDDKGNLLPGAEFKIYKVTSYDENRTAENQEKTLLKLKTIRDGLYDAREVTDTNTIKTCKDNELQKCSDINPTLTYNGYIYTWTNFEEKSLNQNKERVEIKEGEALIQYLEYNNYYVIEEVKAPNGYSLPKNSEDRFTIVHIVPESDVIDTEKQFINKPTPFTFYKYDEYNRPLDGGKFKLQKLNDNKKYVDVTVTKEESDGKNFYKVDKNSTNTILETINGEATVYYLEEGQYRILEVEAPSGYELPKKTINVATFFVDNVGNVYGSSIITNKPKTETTTYNPSAKAELIVNVQTGQTRIKYGLIIILILLSISGLIYIQSKKSVKRGKKNEKK